MTPETVFTILLCAAGGVLLGGALGSGNPIGWLVDGLRGLWDAHVRVTRKVIGAARAGTGRRR